jgi:hypothetical protein
MKKNLIILIIVSLIVVFLVLIIGLNFRDIINARLYEAQGCCFSDGFWVSKVFNKKGDINTCEKKIKNLECKYFCIGIAAAYAKSPEICEKIPKETAADYYAECLTKIAFATENIEICNKIPEGRISGKMTGPDGWPFKEMCLKRFKEK